MAIPGVEGAVCLASRGGIVHCRGWSADELDGAAEVQARPGPVGGHGACLLLHCQGEAGAVAERYRRTYQPPPPPPPPPPPEPPPPPPPENPDPEEVEGWAAIIAALMPVATDETVLEKPPELEDQSRPV